MRCDVTKSLERQVVLQYLEETHGRLDVLVLNAGVSGFKGSQLYIEDD